MNTKVQTSLEKFIIMHCAPTLASIKIANLFSYQFESIKNTKIELKNVNALLNQKGVFIKALQWRKSSVLLYVYRPVFVQKVINKKEVQNLLTQFDYSKKEFSNLNNAISHLKKRLCKYQNFPHEIGIFLGYPLDDVQGFIENGGKNCKACGFWKIYCNVCEKQKIFEKYKKCTKVYSEVYNKGRKLFQMTVAC